VKDKILHPYKTTGKIIASCTSAFFFAVNKGDNERDRMAAALLSSRKKF